MKNKKREGFAVKVDDRKVWVVLRTRKPGGPLHATFWWKNKMYWRATGCLLEAAAKRVAVDEVEKVMGASKDTLTLRQAIDKFIEGKWPTEESYCQDRKTVRVNLNTFALVVGDDLNLQALSVAAAKQCVQSFVDKRRMGEPIRKAGAKIRIPKPRTLKNEVSKIRRLFEWLMQREQVSWIVNPASASTGRKIELPKLTKVIKPPIAPDDLVKLLRAAKLTPIWPSVLFCLTAGFRPVGTLRVQWSDINFTTAKVGVFEKNKGRQVPLGKWVLSELSAWKLKHGGEFVVGLSDRSMHRWMKTIQKKQGLPREATLQGLRRTFISTNFHRGVRPELVASVAGNSVGIIEKHYMDLQTMNATVIAEQMDFSGMLADDPYSSVETKNHSKNHSKRIG